VSKANERLSIETTTTQPKQKRFAFTKHKG